MDVLTIAVAVLFVAICIAWMRYKLKTVKHLQSYESIHDLKVEEAKTKNNLHILRKRIQEETLKHNGKMEEAIRQFELKKQLVQEATLDADVIEAGLFHTEYSFVDSERWKEKLKECRDKQKQLIRAKKAAICSKEWIVDGSAKAGAKMVQEKHVLMLRAFNGECDNFIGRVTYRNGGSMRDKIRKAFEDINTLGAEKQCFLSPELKKLKLQELELVFGYRESKEQEKQEQREIREQMREEEKAIKEMERAQRESEEEESRLSMALEKARMEIADKVDASRADFEEKIRLLEQQLAEAGEAKERAISRAQLTRAGHVYVISNVGSFGEDIYKIGLT